MASSESESIVKDAVKEAVKESSTDGNSETLVASLLVFFSNPVNIGLTLLCAYLFYKLFKSGSSDNDSQSESFKLPPPLPKRDMTLDELHKYNGKGPDGRICLAINGKIYDCTKGRRFYGPDGPYAPLAGRDATRAFAYFDVQAVKDDWDDISDLTPSQMSSVQEWEMQFSERYEYVGKLVKDASEIRSYEDDDVAGDDEQGGDLNEAENPKDK